MPWEYGGLSNGGNGVAHLDLAVEEGEFVILSCGVSQDAPVDVIDKPSCWGYSMEELQKAQAEDRDLQFLLAWLKDTTEPA